VKIRSVGCAAWLLAASSATVTACSSEAGGGAGSGAPTLDSNVMPVLVNAGPGGAQAGFVNGLFASVTICTPGSSTSCQTIDGISIDTGSTGLRILSSAITIPLPQDKDANGDTLANCMPFEDGSYLFGPVARADVQMGGERASSIPIQIVADPASTSFAKPPDACSSGGQNGGTLDGLGANGILGLDFYQQDCGAQCISDTTSAIYFRCSSSSCMATTAPLENQVTNPVTAFPTDNNGIAIALPSIPADGSASVAGTLTFGIGTRSNNALGGATVVQPANDGTIATAFGGQSYPSSSIDSGSNAIFFLDPGASGIGACKVNSDFYCPMPSVALTASLVGSTGASQMVSFAVANADSLLARDDYAFDDLAGPNAPLVGFLWGLPFFFDRTIFTAFERSSDGTGAYWAYTPRP
jgi:hypothetical protein